MGEYHQRVYDSVIKNQKCPKCGALAKEGCKNNSTNNYYPPHLKRYEEWVKNGRMI